MISRGPSRCCPEDIGQAWIVGSDECGYGSWAGPLVVAGAAVPREWADPTVTDSKKMSDSARVAAVRKYRDTVKWKVVVVPSEKVDELGVWKAVIMAHRAVHDLLGRLVEGEALHVVDGLQNAQKSLPGLITLPKADNLVPAVSLASCFAKVTQCQLMDEAEKKHPGYGFGSHRGYGVPAHKKALQKLGACPIHRRSYSPIKRLLAGGTP